MSKIAVWTDENEKVTRIHHNPSEVDTTGGFVADNKPQDSGTAVWVEDSLHYSEEDGFYYKSENPFKGLNLSNNEKESLYIAVRRSDLVQARNIVETALNT